MNLTLNGGTPRQQRWVQDALAECSYPFDLLTADVTVVWADTLPPSSDLGHAHSYMVTQNPFSGTFVITIASWADDFRNPNNQGLPNPARDICDFYKQSFVHELGHVAHFSLVGSPPLRQTLAALLWTADNTGGSGRRFGTLADWDSTTWANNIMEACAEFIKCAFYQGRLIFMNRTTWNVDEPAWGDVMTLLLPSQGGFTDDFSADHTAGYERSGNGPPWFVVENGTLSLDLQPADGVTEDLNENSFRTGDGIGIIKVDALANNDISGFQNQVALWLVDGGGGFARLTRHSPSQLGVHLTDIPLTPLEVMFAPVFPCWLVLRVAGTTIQAEAWDIDPLHGSAPIAVSGPVDTWDAPNPATPSRLGIEGAAANTFIPGHATPGAIVLDDWKWLGHVSPAIPPYPFAPLWGKTEIGVGFRGQFAVSR